MKSLRASHPPRPGSKSERPLERSEQYVTQQAWRGATLERCPLHPEGGCGLGEHGSYPQGSLVIRAGCCRMTPIARGSRVKGASRRLQAPQQRSAGGSRPACARST